MKFKDFNESFDKPYKWEVSSKRSFGFETDSGIYYIVTFTKREDHYLLTFETEDGDMMVTGTGDAFKIFATVIDIVRSKKKLLSKQPMEFEADSEEPSRVKLYKTMSKKFMKELGFKKLKVIVQRDDVTFRMEK